MKASTRIALLHDLLTEELINRLEKGEETAKDVNGELVATSVKPATLAVIAKFLKDNHIESAVPDDKMTKLNSLLSSATERLEDYDNA